MSSRVLRWAERVLVIAGASMLGYCAFVLVDSQIFQSREGKRLDRQLYAGVALSEPLANLAAGELIGRIEIPSLSLSAIVAEGADELTLRRGVGHIPGTGLPGHTGNVGLSGHRDTFFRPLRNIHHDDTITITTAFAKYRYRVVKTWIAGPHDLEVLDPAEKEILTLVTCYPFYFVGPAPDRFIVRAERVT